MNIQVSMNHELSIYEQIEHQIKTLILEGQLVKDVQLPSIRQMALTLKVGVITVKRAYDELIQAGFLYSVVGKGVFVAHINKEQVKDSYIETLKIKLAALKPLFDLTGLSKEAIIEMLEHILEASDERTRD